MESYIDLFPLNSQADTIRLFASELDKRDPNLLLLSLVAGAIETAFCVSSGAHAWKSTVSSSTSHREAFPLEMSQIEEAYRKFLTELQEAVPPSAVEKNGKEYTERSVIKMVADFVWKPLSRSFHKDRPHIQTIYSFMTSGRLLDCFGLALTVVAACQQLGLADVHLALSEDHSWIVFGPNGCETAEIAWVGKGNEKKRGQPIEKDAPDKNWLYLNGWPVICNRHMEVAAIVTSMNPGIDSKTDSEQLGQLQQALLWLCFDKNHIHRYPMGLGTLGDLEEIKQTPGRPSPEAIFQLGVKASCTYYCNAHVYPHSFLGGYLFRQGRFKDAMQCWMDAALAVSGYKYSKEDSEVYKEFHEIVHDFLPDMMKSPAGAALSLDPELYAMVLTFFDKICLWESGSQTPILHCGWAKRFITVVTRFPSNVRKKACDNTIMVIDMNSAPVRERPEKWTVWMNKAAQQSIDCTRHMCHIMSASLSDSPSSTRMTKVRYIRQCFGLQSEKLRGVSEMLTTADKLNPAALELQLTALSQTIDITSARSRKRRHDQQ